MSPIATHFEQLMPHHEQERIGATPLAGESLRVMRTLDHYEQMRQENHRLRELLRPLAECAAEYYATSPGAIQLDRVFYLSEARDAAEALGLPTSAK